VKLGVSPTSPKTRDIGRRCGNAPSSVGHHGLMYASQNGHAETIIEMIPYAKAENLEHAMCLATSAGHTRAMSALLESGNVSPDTISRVITSRMGSTQEGGETLLMLATSSLEPKAVKLLLEKGASVHKTPVKILNHSSCCSVYIQKSETRLEARTALHRS